MSALAGRAGYYLTDKFLRAWLAAIAGPVAALNFRPAEQLVADAETRLHEVEGAAFEKLVGVLYEERSREAIGDFRLTAQVRGYWDRGDTEIDLVAISEEKAATRFGSCERSAAELISDLPAFDGHVERFLDQFPRYRTWRLETVPFAPHIPDDVGKSLIDRGRCVQDLTHLTVGL